MPTYSDDILRLAETTPVAIANGAITADLANRLCGDRITIAADWDNALIRQIEWEVEGCAILKASAAYLARTLKGKDRVQVADLLAQFAASFGAENIFRTGPLAAVYKLPSRYKCALLPWQACENLLRELER
jgi:nitrogen fixation NifU-like protein